MDIYNPIDLSFLNHFQCVNLEREGSLVPRLCAKFTQRAWARSSRDVCHSCEFCTASDERAGPGNEAREKACQISKS